MSKPEPQDEEQGPLQWATTADLLQELFKRFEHAAFIGRVDRRDVGPDAVEQGITGSFTGDRHACIGLCLDAAHRALHSLRRIKKPKGF